MNEQEWGELYLLMKHSRKFRPFLQRIPGEAGWMIAVPLDGSYADLDEARDMMHHWRNLWHKGTETIHRLLDENAPDSMDGRYE